MTQTNETEQQVLIKKIENFKRIESILRKYQQIANYIDNASGWYSDNHDNRFAQDACRSDKIEELVHYCFRERMDLSRHFDANCENTEVQ